MRKIEKEMLAAVCERRNWHCDNTQVIVSLDKSHIEVYLHGNVIYSCDGEHVRFTLAGWNTQTTRSRLRALGVNVTTRNYIPMYEGNQIRENNWYSV